MPRDLSLVDLLAPDQIGVGLAAADKEGVLDAMIRLVAPSPDVLNTERLAADVRRREARMSTGVGEGLAFPHARSPAVRRTVVAFATLRPGVDFDAIDGAPVSLVFFLAGPEDARAQHVRLLSRVSRLMSDRDVRQRLADAAGPDAVLATIHAAEAAFA